MKSRIFLSSCLWSLTFWRSYKVVKSFSVYPVSDPLWVSCYQLFYRQSRCRQERLLSDWGVLLLDVMNIAVVVYSHHLSRWRGLRLVLKGKRPLSCSFQVFQVSNMWTGNMLIIMLTSTWNSLGFVLKTASFNDSESTLSLRDNSFIHGALSDLKLCRMFSFT